jgi:hypothetical protein
MNGGIVGLATVGSLTEVVGNSTLVPVPLVGSCCLMLGFPDYCTRLALSSSASRLLDPKLLFRALLPLIPPGNITSLFPNGCLSFKPSSPYSWNAPLPFYANGLSP